MRQLLSFLVAFGLLTGTAEANLSLVFGAHQTSPRIDSTGSFNEDGSLGFQLGVRADLAYLGGAVFQSGLIAVQRKFETGNGFVDYTFLNLDVPLFLNFRVADAVSLYFGPKISINISDNCDASVGSCTIEDEDINQITVPVELGVEFDLSPSWAFGLYYQYAATPILSDDNGTPPVDAFADLYGLNFLYRF
ncbi:MAG: outer membrane beta-barrel protein [Pseudomonadota bacterium]